MFTLLFYSEIFQMIVTLIIIFASINLESFSPKDDELSYGVVIFFSLVPIIGLIPITNVIINTARLAKEKLDGNILADNNGKIVGRKKSTDSDAEKLKHTAKILSLNLSTYSYGEEYTFEEIVANNCSNKYPLTEAIGIYDYHKEYSKVESLFKSMIDMTFSVTSMFDDWKETEPSVQDKINVIINGYISQMEKVVREEKKKERIALEKKKARRNEAVNNKLDEVIATMGFMNEIDEE